MKSISKKLVLALVTTSIFSGCSIPDKMSTSDPNRSFLNEKSNYGTVKLSFNLPDKFLDQGVFSKKGFNTKSIDSPKINRLKFRVDSATTSYSIERTVELVLGGLQADLNLPLDKLYTITVQGFNDNVQVSGAEVSGYFSLTSASVTPVVTVNQATTPVSKIIKELKVKLGTFDPVSAINIFPTPTPLPSPTASEAGTVEKPSALPASSASVKPSTSPTPSATATPVANALKPDSTALNNTVFKLKDIDIPALEDVVKRARLGYHPSLVNTAPFVDYIIANQKVPVDVPQNAMLKPGSVKGKISGLKPGETVLVSVGDPSSKNTVVVTAPNLSKPTDTTFDPEKLANPVPFVIDNVTPGSWLVSVFSSGYSLSDKKKVLAVNSDAIATADFTMKEGLWTLTPLSVSANIGNSDEASAILDAGDNIHVVWRQDGFNTDNNSGVIFYSRWNGTSWTTQGVNISQYGDTTITGSQYPSVSTGVDRLPHVVWSAKDSSGQRKIYYNYLNGTTWQMPAAISGSDNGVAPSISVDSTNGFMYTVWESNGSIMLSQYNKEVWSSPIKVGDGFMPKTAVGSDGLVHVVWHTSGAQSIQYANWSLKRGLSQVDILPFNTLGSDVSNSLDITVDRFNRLHAVWRNDAYVQYSLRSNSSWSVPEIVNQLNSSLMIAKSGASISVAPTGNINVSWVSIDSNNNQVVRLRRKLNNGWKVPSTKIVDTTQPVVIDVTKKPVVTKPNTVQTIKHSENIDGYVDMPLSQLSAVDGSPIAVADSLGNIHVMWSAKGLSSNDTDLFHSIKRDPNQK